MSQTLVAVFEDRTSAEAARQELLTSGLTTQQITVQSGDASTAATRTDDVEDEGVISRFFRSLFGDDDRSSQYAEAGRRGHATIVAELDDADVDRVVSILERHDVIDIDERASQWRNEGWTGASTGAAATSTGVREETSAARSVEGTTRVPVIEEELQVGKREVQRGGVRVYTKLTERPVEESVQLREEHARIERRDVDRPVTAADLAALQEGTIELRETAEEAVVSKRARVVEEIEIGKDVTQRTETVRDTVRNTEVRIEELDEATRRSAATLDTGTTRLSDDIESTTDETTRLSGSAVGSVSGSTGGSLGGSAGGSAGGSSGGSVAGASNAKPGGN